MKISILQLPDDVLERMAEGLRVLAHPDRLKIIEVLEQAGEISVGQIEILVGRPQSIVSHHLGRMKRAGLLVSTRIGKNVCYRISDDRPVTILNCIRSKAGDMMGEDKS
jgi:ArsR family transcriptional regulator